jgi:hypothetical protein
MKVCGGVDEYSCPRNYFEVSAQLYAPAASRGKRPRNPLDRGLCGPQSRF